MVKSSCTNYCFCSAESLLVTYSESNSVVLSLSCRYWENEKVRLDYRPVHMNTLDDEIETFPPKARVY